LGRGLKNFGVGVDAVCMSNPPNGSKYIAPGIRAQSAPIPVTTDPFADVDTRLSPRVEALRKLVASGQYQVSPRYLAQRIIRAAGLKAE
jgi:hypothetical protein